MYQAQCAQRTDDRPELHEREPGPTIVWWHQRKVCRKRPGTKFELWVLSTSSLTNWAEYRAGTSSSLGSNLDPQKIRWHAFGVDQSEWLSFLTPSCYIFNNIPNSLKEKIEKVGANYIWTVSLGVNGAWAMTFGITHVAWDNVPPNLHKKLGSGRVIRVRWPTCSDPS